MKTFAHLLFLIALSGCYRFQYATLKSGPPATASLPYTTENERYRITYQFYGEDCPVHVQVFNKSPQPLYVDWKKSSLILEDKRYPFWEDASVLQTTSNSTEVKRTNSVTNTQTVSQGSIHKQEQLSFVPPQSLVEISPMQLRDHQFDIHSDLHREKVSVQTRTGTKAGESVAYSKETSPLKFRIYLALSPTEDFSEPLYVDQEFWVADILTSRVHPVDMVERPSNQFQLYGHTAAGAVASTLLAIVIVAAALIGAKNSN